MRDVVTPNLAWEKQFTCECGTTGIAEAEDLITNRSVSDQRDDYYLAAGTNWYFMCPHCNRRNPITKETIPIAVRDAVLKGHLGTIGY